MIPSLAIAGVLLLALYPVLVYFGLQALEPRWLVLLIPLALLLGAPLRNPGSPITAAGARIWIPAGAFLVLAFLANQESLLRLYPAVINTTLAAAFLHSLYGPVTLIERLARLSEPDLPPEAVAYCRQVTRIWALYMGVSAAIALWTALFASREVWAIYNGLISYLCIGLLFGVEYLVRRRVRRRVRGTAGVGT